MKERKNRWPKKSKYTSSQTRRSVSV